MKNIFKLFISVFFLIISIKTYSQLSALTFVQNKGQWKGDFEFKSSYGGGAIFIEKKGFTIVQYNSEEVASIFGHGHKKIEGKDKQPDIYRADFVKDESNDSAKKSSQIHMHAYNMRFLGASAMTEFVAEKPTGEESNYFLGNDSTKWQRGIKNYLNVLQKNIYPGIDLRYYSYGGKLKYDFIVQPGADPSRILMKYDGVDGMRIKNKELVLETSLGVSKELSPYSYQIVDGKKKEISCSYKLQGNVVRFNLDQHDPQAALVIDPELVLATYTGSDSDNWGYSAAPGPDGSLYAAGIVFGPEYPTTIGAFSREFKGGPGFEGKNNGVDISFTRLDPKNKAPNKPIYSTYLGGTDNEFPHSIYVNANGEAYLMGNTYSKKSFPFKASIGTLGGSDLFVTKFNQDGTDIIGSVIIGGYANDGENINGENLNPIPGTLKLFYGDNSRSEIILDVDGNPLIAASSSSRNFPVWAANQQNLNGKQDGVLFKLDANLTTLLFSTYIGGSDDDAAFSLAENPVTKNIFVSGVTKSKDLQINSSNTFGNKFNSGSIDGFISEFTADGRWVNGIFIGTPKDDFIYGIQFDQSGYPYIMGVTYGNWEVKHYNNSDFEVENTKQFISKLNMDLTGFVYSTVFGAPGVTIPTLVPVAFMVDRCENVFLSGWGNLGDFTKFCYTEYGTRNFPQTGGTVSNIKQSDGLDFYFFALAKDGEKLLYGDFYGQTGGIADHVDGGTSRFDKNGIIYQAICANCGGDIDCNGVTKPYETYPRSASVRGVGFCNLFAVKIDFQLSGVAAGIKASIDGVPYDTSGCAPLSVQFSDTIGIANTTYNWYIDGVLKSSKQDDPTFDYTFGNNTNPYNVKLIAENLTRLCQTKAEDSIQIFAGSNKATLKAEARRQSCFTKMFDFVNLSLPGSSPFGVKAFEWDWQDGSKKDTLSISDANSHPFIGTGTHIVILRLIDPSFCNVGDTIHINVNVKGETIAKIDGPKFGCIDKLSNTCNLTFVSIGEGGQYFKWLVDGSEVVPESPNYVSFNYSFTDATDHIITLNVRDPSACPGKDQDSYSWPISIKKPPVALFDFNPPEVNTAIVFKNKTTDDYSDPKSLSYNWYFGDNSESRDFEPTHLYQRAKDYEVTLLATNKYGCVDTVTKTLSALVSNLASVPNAFIPNSSGLNRTVNVQGFAIEKMDFRIYNRWGQLMFASSSKNYGWDGMYKGVLQPMDVYAYTLQVKFSDGTQVSKKGDITLIR